MEVVIAESLAAVHTHTHTQLCLPNKEAQNIIE